MKRYWVTSLLHGPEGPLAGCMECGSDKERMPVDHAGTCNLSPAVNQNIDQNWSVDSYLSCQGWKRGRDAVRRPLDQRVGREPKGLAAAVGQHGTLALA